MCDTVGERASRAGDLSALPSWMDCLWTGTAIPSCGPTPATMADNHGETELTFFGHRIAFTPSSASRRDAMDKPSDHPKQATEEEKASPRTIGDLRVEDLSAKSTKGIEKKAK